MNKTFGAAAFLAAALVTSTASANDYRVTIVNKTGMAMKHFYASVTSTNAWEEDILGKDVLEDGESVEVEIDDGSEKCHYDFKAVFENGASLERADIDVCKTESFTYTR
jgi:hypothetical protein